MASSFVPGLLGVDPPQNRSCQDILSMSSPTQYGWLRRRCLRNKFHIKLKVFDWPQFYVIVVDKCLYYYKNETSKTPSGAVSLYGYNRVFRSSDVKATGVPWSFKIEHVQPGMKSFYFSASSEREMIRWMSAIKIEMLAANNLRSEQRRCDFYSPSDESLSSWGSSEYNSLECEIYNKGSTEKARQSILSEVLSNEDCFDSDSEVPTIYESPVPCEPSSESLVPNFTAMPVINEEKGGDANTGDNSQKDDGGNMNKESSDYWASIHFQGSKVEASEVINGIAFNGVYLVRKSEDGQSVLQVYADDMSRKYRIFHREDGQVTLSIANGPNFDSLEDLLFHYYSKTLPNSSHYLTVPYKLHPEFIYNERH